MEYTKSFFNIKTLLLGCLGIALVLMGVVLFAPSTHAQAADCDVGQPRPYIGYNRKAWCGFFNNEGWTEGPALRGGTWNPDGSFTDPTAANPGIPDGLDTAQEFVDMILDDYHNGDQRARTAAEFMILSMLGVVPAQEGTVPKAVSPAQIAEWQDRVLSYADIDDNSTGNGVSTGQNGQILWNEQRHLDCGEVNTYYQIQQDDIAPFEVNTSNTPDCNDPSFVERYIVFVDNSDNDLLQVRAICMNPAGEIAPLEAAAPVEENGTLGDKVFEDKNNNGVFDEDDEGIPGVTLALYRSTTECGQEELIATTTTDENGDYQFSNLPVVSDEGAFAKYVVVVTDENGVLEGYTATVGEAGVNNNSQDPNGYCMTLTFTERSDQTGDFGYYREGEVVAPGGELAPTGQSAIITTVVALVSAIAGVGLLVAHRVSKHVY